MSLFPIKFQQVVPFPLEGLLAGESCWGKDFELNAQKKYIVTAASGKGKSTMISYLSGLRKDFKGSIYFGHKNIEDLSEKEWINHRANDISVVYQDLRLFGQLTAIENICLPGKLSPIESVDTIMEMAAILGIENKMNITCQLLSFGQQQRVAIIRSLVRPFKLLLLDEPMSHLDDENRKQAWVLIEKFIERRGATLLVTSLGESFHIDWDAHIKV